MMELLRILDRRQRALRAALSLHLPGRPDIVDPASFGGRRVIVVGPAETVFEDLEGTSVDDYDVVVRLNNGMSLAEGRPDVLGHRTDILVHNLREVGPRNAGAIPAPDLKAKGVKTVICPNWGSSDLRRRYRAKRAALAAIDGPSLQVLPPDFMMRLRSDLKGRAPTVGISIASFFLDCAVAELAIHGFTFFETRYAESYNDAVRTALDARNWVDAAGAHEPKSEKALLRRRLEQPDCPPVTLGAKVRFHLMERAAPVEGRT